MFTTTMLMLFVLTFSTVQLFAQAEKEKLMAEIDGLNAKMIKESLSGVVDANSTLYAEDIYYMPNYSPMIEGKRMMMQHQQESKAAGYKMLSMDLKIHELMTCENMIIEIGMFNISMSIPGMPNPISDKGKYVTIWERKKDGSLQIKVETWNTDTNPMEKMGDGR